MPTFFPNPLHRFYTQPKPIPLPNNNRPHFNFPSSIISRDISSKNPKSSRPEERKKNKDIRTRPRGEREALLEQLGPALVERLRDLADHLARLRLELVGGVAEDGLEDGGEAGRELLDGRVRRVICRVLATVTLKL